MSVLAIILAGGPGKKLGVLTEQRGLPFIPFGGKYRIIDFTLTNLAVSGLDQAAMLIQFCSEPLRAYLENTRVRGADGWRSVDLPLWQASKERTGCDQYLGSADALYQNRDFIARSGCDTVLILAGDQVYRQDYRDLLRFYQEKGADLTMAVKNVAIQEAGHYGTLEIDPDRRIRWFAEQPAQPQSSLVSLAMYAVKTDFLLAKLAEDAHDPASEHSIGWNLVARMVAPGRAYAYPFEGYWTYMNGLETYWRSNLDILDDSAAFAVCAAQRIAPAAPEGKASAKIGPGGRVTNSLVSDGCVIDGDVVHSVLAPGVWVEEGASVRNSVILAGTVVRRGATVTRCVLDEDVEIGPGARAGAASAGITSVGKGRHVPTGEQVS